MALTKGLTWEELEEKGFKVITDKKTGKKRIDFDAPPAGKKFTPLKTNEDDIKTREIDRRFVTWHMFSGTTKRVVMEVIDAKDAPAADASVADLKAYYKKQERKRRHRIINPKTGRRIMCPEGIRCFSEKCPIMLGMQVAEDTDLSLDDDRSEIVKTYIYADDPTADTAIMNMMWDGFKDELRKKTPHLTKIIEWEECGYSYEEILVKLKKRKDQTSWYHYQWKRIRKLWKEYND